MTFRLTDNVPFAVTSVGRYLDNDRIAGPIELAMPSSDREPRRPLACCLMPHQVYTPVESVALFALAEAVCGWESGVAKMNWLPCDAEMSLAAAAYQIGRNGAISRDKIDIHGQPFDSWHLPPRR